VAALRTEEPDRPVRVGYLLRMYPRFSQTFIVNEILELERQGLDIHIAALRKPTEGRFQEQVCRVRAEVKYLPETICRRVRRTCGAHGTLVRRSPSRYLKATATVLRHAGATLFDLVQAGFLLRWARRRRIELLHVHFGTSEATVALLAKLLGGPPYSLALHTWDVFRDEVDRTLLARKINESRFTVVNTEYHRREVTRVVPGVDAAKIRVSYNGVDLARFRSSDRPRLERTVSLLAVGRMVEKKGFIHLVRAVGLLRNRCAGLTCTIVGGGRERSRLREEINRRGLRSSVVLMGPLHQERVRELMQSCGCFVLPCVRAKDGNIDGIPNVLIEALACECPSISTRISGVPELIENGVTGLLVEPGDEQALADAIHTMVTNPELAVELAAAGRRRVAERFDIRRNIAVLHEWLRTAAEATRVTDRVATRSAEQHRVSTVSPVPKAP
jgi:glycosyltransferase involved in cell wall biosynthesis